MELLQKHVRISAAVSLGVVVSTVIYRRFKNRRRLDSKGKAVIITGCDSGLGFSLALDAHRLGFIVFAACLQPEGRGARRLVEQCGQEKLFILPVDVTNEKSVADAKKNIENLLTLNNLGLAALVNNAGVMVFGEFEWQTERLIKYQLDVNLLGTMRITKALCPLLRTHKGRIITVTSHCALAGLPGIAVYSASKAGLSAWCDALRVEEAKYGVTVVKFIPGSLPHQTNIAAKQGEYADEMESAMAEDDKKVFGDYFRRFNAYLSGLFEKKEPTYLMNQQLVRNFESALLSPNPSTLYINTTFRYSVYHFLFATVPTWLRDKLVIRFVSMPSWKKE